MTTTLPHPALLIAAGGGGDALAAVVVARSRFLGLDAEKCSLATFIWERKLFDPMLGPRGPGDLIGLRPVGKRNHRITADTALRRGSTFVPRLAGQHQDVAHYLLDPAAGVDGLRGQLWELLVLTKSRSVVVVDAGGDILASGKEPGLASPLADSLVLAATADLPVDVIVVVMAPALDGELTPSECSSARAELSCGASGRFGRLPPRLAQSVLPTLKWFPSEVTGLAVLAAIGHRGVAELRAAGMRVSLTDMSPELWAFPGHAVLNRNRIAASMVGTTSLEQSETVVRSQLGRAELDREREALRRLSIERESRQRTDRALEAELEAYSEQAQERGISFLTTRRLAEVLRLEWSELLPFLDTLPGARRRFIPPVWYTGRAYQDPVRRRPALAPLDVRHMQSLERRTDVLAAARASKREFRGRVESGLGIA